MNLSARSSTNHFGYGVAPALITQNIETLGLQPASPLIRVHNLLRKKEALPTMDARMILGVSEDASREQINMAYEEIDAFLRKAIANDAYEDTRKAKEEVKQYIDKAYWTLNPDAKTPDTPTIRQARHQLDLVGTKVTPNTLKEAYQNARQKTGSTDSFLDLYRTIASQVGGLNLRESNNASPSSQKNKVVEMLRLPANPPLQMVRLAHQSVQDYYRNSIQTLEERLRNLQKASGTLQNAYDTYQGGFSRYLTWLPLRSKKPIESLQ